MKVVKKLIKLNIILLIIGILCILSLYTFAYFSPILDIKSTGQYYIYDDNGEIIYQGSGTNKWVSLDDISPYMKEALISLDKEWPSNLDILVVGEGNYKSSFLKTINDLENRNRIHFISGTLDVKQYYFASDVYATCTLHENHSLSIL